MMRGNLLARLTARGFSFLSPVKGQPIWINEHSSRILEEFRTAGDAEKKKSYEMLIEGVHRRQELLLSYNIGIPVEVREKEMNKRAARLVGLRMPHDDSRN